MRTNRIAKALFLCSIVCTPLFPATIDSVSISLNGVDLAINGVAQAGATRVGDVISFTIADLTGATGSVSGAVNFADGNLLKLESFLASCDDANGCTNPFLLLITAVGSGYTGQQQFGLQLSNALGSGTITSGCLAASVSFDSPLSPPACNSSVPSVDGPTSGGIAVDLSVSGVPTQLDFQFQPMLLTDPQGSPAYLSMALFWDSFSQNSLLAIGANSADLLAQPVADVPEPGTLALLGIGLVCFGVARRKMAN